MPTYEYACRSCGEHLEVVQSFKDDPLTECPGCHGQLRKVFSAAGLIFKGSGWHIKDYATSSRGKAGASDDGEATASGSGKKDASTSGEATATTGGKADATSAKAAATTADKQSA